MRRFDHIIRSISRNSRLGLVLLASTFSIAGFFLTGNVSAAGAKFTISPTSGSITQGSTIEFTIQAVPETSETYAVQACVVYDASKLSLENIDYSSNPLPSTNPSAPSSDCNAGEAQLGRNGIKGDGTVTHATGNFTVAVVRFKALQSSGTATVSFDDAKSFIDSATPSGSGSASVTMSAVPVAPPTNNPGSPGPTNTDTSKKTAPTTSTKTNGGSVAAITDSGRSANETAQAVSSDVTASQTPKTAETVNNAKTTNSKRVLYIVAGAILLAIIAAGILIKFVGLPFGRGGSGGLGTTGGPTPPEIPGSTGTPPVDMSNIADPNLPPPSSVVTPNSDGIKRL